MAQLTCTNGTMDVQEILTTINGKVERAGDTMEGALNVLAGAVGAEAIQAQEVDDKIAKSLIDSGVKLSPDGKAIINADGSWIKNQITAGCLFNGNGANGEVEILGNGGYNIASVTRRGVGNYYVSFETEMDSAVFMALGNSDHSEAFVSTDAWSTVGCAVYNRYHNGNLIDDIIGIIVLGGKV